jgi:hypothetical protein
VRATLDRWLAELSLVQQQRLTLYRQLAFGGGLKAKASLLDLAYGTLTALHLLMQSRSNSG